LKFLRDPIRVESDKEGIPVVSYGTRFGIRIGRVYNPLTIALYGILYFGLDQKVGPVELPVRHHTWKDIVAMADWLVKIEERGPMCSTWNYDFPWPTYQLLPPWKSAMAELFGGLFLISMFRATDKERYRRSADLHLRSLLTPTSEGGLAIADKETNGWWFPEYYSPTISAPYVLNGMMYVLLGLRHASSILGDDRYLCAFELGLLDLRKKIRRFDGGFFTYYDSVGNPADEKYHAFHVQLLDLLVSAADDHVLARIRSRWKHMSQGYWLKEPLILLSCLLRSRKSGYRLLGLVPGKGKVAMMKVPRGTLDSQNRSSRPCLGQPLHDSREMYESKDVAKCYLSLDGPQEPEETIHHRLQSNLRNPQVFDMIVG